MPKTYEELMEEYNKGTKASPTKKSSYDELVNNYNKRNTEQIQSKPPEYIQNHPITKQTQSPMEYLNNLDATVKQKEIDKFKEPSGIPWAIGKAFGDEAGKSAQTVKNAITNPFGLADAGLKFFGHTIPTVTGWVLGDEAKQALSIPSFERQLDARKQLSEENPKSHFGGKLAGDIVTGAPIMKGIDKVVGKALPFLAKVGTAGTIATRGAKGAVDAGVVGGVEGLSKGYVNDMGIVGTAKEMVNTAKDYAQFGGLLTGGLATASKGINAVKNVGRDVDDIFGGFRPNVDVANTSPSLPKKLPTQLEANSFTYNKPNMPFVRPQNPLPSGRYKVVSQPLKQAEQNMSNAIETLQNKYGTSNIQGAISDIVNDYAPHLQRKIPVDKAFVHDYVLKNDGIDLPKIISEIDNAQGITRTLPTQGEAGLKRVVGLAPNKSYDITNKIGEYANTPKTISEKLNAIDNTRPIASDLKPMNEVPSINSPLENIKPLETQPRINQIPEAGKMVETPSIGNSQSNIQTNTLKNAEYMQSPEAQKVVDDLDLTYERKPNVQSTERAIQMLSDDYQGTYNRIKESGINSAEDTVASGEILRTLRSEGNTAEYKSFVKKIQPEYTNMGQILQALKTWKYETLDGAIFQANKVAEASKKILQTTNPAKYEKTMKLVNDEVNSLDLIIKDGLKMLPNFNLQLFADSIKKGMRGLSNKNYLQSIMELIETGKYSKEELADIIMQKYKIPSVSVGDITKIENSFTNAGKFPKGDYQNRASLSEVEAVINGKRLPDWEQKLRAIQRIFMLGTLKTLIKNPLSNMLSAPLESARQNLIGVPLDKLMSKMRGSERNFILSPLDKGIASAKGSGTALKEWGKDVYYGKDTSPFKSVDYRPQGSAFSENNVFGKVSNRADKVVTKGLELGDRPFLQGAYEGRMAELKKIKKVNEISPEMHDEATRYALDKYFQGDGELVKIVGKGAELSKNPIYKAAYNFMIPFRKVPANLVDRAFEYLGGGYLKAIGHAVKHSGKPSFNQRYFVDTLSRGIGGTGLMYLGMVMSEADMLKGSPEKSKSAEAYEKSQGIKPYSLNINGTSTPIDWTGSLASTLLTGADIYQNSKDKETLLESFNEGIATGVNSVANMSVFQTLRKSLSGYNPASSLGSGLLSTTTQATPSLTSQIAQFNDEYERDTSGGIKDRLKARIPGQRETLPIKISSQGKELKTSQGADKTQRAWDAFIAPSITSTLTTQPHQKELMRIYKETKENEILPPLAPKTIQYKNESYKLTQQQINDYQKGLGTESEKVILKKINSPLFKELKNDDKKAKALKTALNEVQEKEKKKMLKILGVLK